jgi:hypothetical protein
MPLQLQAERTAGRGGTEQGKGSRSHLGPGASPEKDDLFWGVGMCQRHRKRLGAGAASTAPPVRAQCALSGARYCA